MSDNLNLRTAAGLLEYLKPVRPLLAKHIKATHQSDFDQILTKLARAAVKEQLSQPIPMTPRLTELANLIEAAAATEDAK